MHNSRRTGAAGGFMARALGTLGAAMLLLTSTGWGALAGDTGFGAINLNAYQGAAAMTGPALKGGKKDPSDSGAPQKSEPKHTVSITESGLINIDGELLEPSTVIDYYGTYNRGGANQPASPMPPLVAPGGNAYSPYAAEAAGSRQGAPINK